MGAEWEMSLPRKKPQTGEWDHLQPHLLNCIPHNEQRFLDSFHLPGLWGKEEATTHHGKCSSPMGKSNPSLWHFLSLRVYRALDATYICHKLWDGKAAHSSKELLLTCLECLVHHNFHSVIFGKAGLREVRMTEVVCFLNDRIKRRRTTLY